MKKDRAEFEYLAVTSTIAEGKYEGSECTDNYTLSPKGLWKLKGLLDAVGIDTEGSIDLDVKELIGLQYLGEVINTEFEGRKYPHVSECLEAEGTEEDEKPSKSKKVEEEEEADEEADEEGEKPDSDGDDFEITESDVNDLDAEELTSLLDELGIKAKLIGGISMKRKAAITALKKAGYLG